MNSSSGSSRSPPTPTSCSPRPTRASSRLAREGARRCSATGSADREGARSRLRASTVGPEGVEVFTTRIDTIYGATFLMLAPEHPLVAAPGRPAGTRPRAAEAQLRAQDRPRRLGRESRRKACSPAPTPINPFSGERVPIWVANFVLEGYGTGAIMARAAHDQRDFEFAAQVRPRRCGRSFAPPTARLPDGGDDDGRVYRRRRRRRLRALRRPDLGRGARGDDGVAEQQGFGAGLDAVPPQGLGHLAPALLGHADSDDPLPGDGIVPVPDDQLPVELPKIVEFTGRGDSPLAHVPEFVNVTCPKCGGAGRARDRHDGHLRGLVVVLLPLRRRAERPPRRSTRRRCSTGARSTSTSAASSTPSCT